MEIEGWVHELDEMVKGEKLSAHAGLIAEKIALLETYQRAASTRTRMM